MPIRLYLDQDTLNFLCDYFSYNMEETKETPVVMQEPNAELFSKYLPF
jgi:hypothetical protein